MHTVDCPPSALYFLRQHGSSGEIQRFQGLCTLPLNILNEKIFLVLWFWCVTLFSLGASVLACRTVLIFRTLRA